MVAIRRYLTSEQIASFKRDATILINDNNFKDLANLWLSLKDGEAAEVWVQGVGLSYANIPPNTVCTPTDCGLAASDSLSTPAAISG